MKANGLIQWITAALVVPTCSVLAQGQGNLVYTFSQPSEGDLEDEVTQHEVKAGGSMKVVHADDYGYDLSVGGEFQANVWTFDDNRFDDIELYKVKVPIVAGYQASDDIHLTAGVTPGIHSDFEEVDSDDFRVEGMLFGTYLYSPEVQLVLGAGFGEEFGDPSAFPIAGVRWQATDELMLDLVFPRPKVSYAVNQDLRLIAAGEPTGGEWNVGKQDKDVADIDVQQKGFRVGIGAEYQAIENGWLFAMVGAEGGRTLQVGVNDEERFDDDVDLDDATFVQIGFRLN